MVKINCNNCMGDRHSSCSNTDTCLCADNNHGVKREQELVDAITTDDPRYQTPKNEPQLYEKAMNDKETLEKYLNDDMKDRGDTENRAIEIINLLITVEHNISKIDIKNSVSQWSKRYGIMLGSPLDKLIEIALTDSKTFTNLINISFQLGLRQKKIMFGMGQLTEASYYLMGRYHIKRIELTGTLIFFNDKYYEKEAEALIRRVGRKVIIKTKNGDMNEIVKMIEDSSKLITWDDIENSVHIKCLLNGIFNIKTGEFSTTFNPEYIILNQIPHHYVTSGDFVNINLRVSEIIKNDQNQQSFYDFLSTTLHPYTGINIQFGGVGIPGTGKSQLCELAYLVLGRKNVSGSPIHLISNDLTTQKDVAFNFLNIDMDMSDETVQKIDVLKRWITQDLFTARGIYEHNTTFRPMARILFMANDLYDIPNEDDAEAIYERTHLIPLNAKFRGQTNEKLNVMKVACTDDQKNEFISYLLRNATWIHEHQKIHFPTHVKTVRTTWNLHGNRIKEFSENWLEKGVEFREDQVEVWNRWLKYSNLRNYPAKDKKKFHVIFDEIIGNSPSKTRLGSGEDSRQVWAYSGFRLKRDEEIEKEETLHLNDGKDNSSFGASQSQSSRSSILSLLSINENNNYSKIINSKITELLELIDKFNKSDLEYTFKDDGD